MPQIYYLPDEQHIEVEEGEFLLEASLRVGIPHTHVCGANARCSTCRVLILQGLENCSDRNPAERAISDHLRFDPTIRLACQTQAFGDVTVRRLAIDAEDMELIEDELSGTVFPEMFGSERQIAILFADIRGFTSFAEKLLPYDVIYILNRYFRQMGRVISRYDGTINNYMGDGLMAIFGMENAEGAAESAVRAALGMIEAMEILNPHLETLYHQRLQIGIGIHYGGVVIGGVGTADDRRVTAIGDAVNLAARIESANKQFGTTLLISEDTYIQVKEQVTIGRCMQVKLPGKSGEYSLYEVVNISAPLPQVKEILRVRKAWRVPAFLSQIQRLFTFFWVLLKRVFR